MFHDADEYERRAREAERLGFATRDPVLREDLFGLARIYGDYASHLRDRPSDAEDAAWRQAVNG